MNPEFTDKELACLCALYLEGMLSRYEERTLFYILTHKKGLNEDEKRIKNLMITEQKIFSSQHKIKKSRSFYYSGVAAAVIALCAIGVPLFITDNSQDATYVVWQDGERITGEKAKELAEASQQEDMEMIRNVMRQHREMLKRNFAVVNMDDYDY